MAGVCLGNAQWRDANADLLQPLDSMLQSAGYRLKFCSIAPDFIFNSVGVSVAFVLMTEWNSESVTATLERFSSVSIAKPPFIPVTDGPMALERMLNLAYVHADSHPNT